MWLSTSQITQCQGLLSEKPHVTTEPCQALNLATLLWEKVGPHMIARKYASRPDWRDQPVLGPALVLYTNGSSLVTRGQGLSAYAVDMEETMVEASSLPSPWSAQQAELDALFQALQLSRGKKTNTYRYAFATLQGSVSGERPLTASEKDIKNKEEIKTLLDAACGEGNGTPLQYSCLENPMDRGDW